MRILIVTIIAMLMGSCIDTARASPADVAIELSRQAPALAGSLVDVDAWQQTATTTAAKLSGGDHTSGFASITCWNNSTTLVYLGGSVMTNVNAATRGMPICTTSSCIGAALELDSAEVFVVVTAGSQVITCFSGRFSAP